MAFSISDFASRLKSGGANPSLFEVKLFNPVASDADALTPFYVRATSIPDSTIGILEIPYFGRKLKIPGERVFSNWTVTIMNDEDFKIRDRMERWSAAINSHQTNLRAESALASLKSDGLVTQYSKTGSAIRTYKFAGLWPTVIGPIELDWENSTQIETFTVEFSVDNWTVDSGVTRTASLA